MTAAAINTTGIGPKQKPIENIKAGGVPSYIAGVRAAEADDIAAWQITTPEGLIAFFSERMLETNRDLRNLIEGQTRRNDTVKSLNEMQRVLNSVKEGEKIEPGHPKWEEFETLLKEVRKGLPDSAIANDIDARLATAGARQTPYADNWADKKTAQSIADQCTGTVALTQLPNGKWQVVATNGPAPGLNMEQSKDLALKLKNVAENMQGANQMDSVRVQELVSRVSQIMSTVSNIIAKLDDGKKTAINNMR